VEVHLITVKVSIVRGGHGEVEPERGVGRGGTTLT
jgi:hypothetical protein